MNMHILDLERPDVASVVYDRDSERLVDNANSDRDFSVLVRCPHVSIERVRGTTFVAQIPQDHFVGMTRILESLFEVVNNTPTFTGEDTDGEDLFTFTSFLYQSSSGKYRCVLDIDDDPETKSLLYEVSGADSELVEVDLEKTVGRTADVVLHIMVTIDVDNSTACFSAVAEEMRLNPQEAPKKSRKRVPVLLGDSKSRA